MAKNRTPNPALEILGTIENQTNEITAMLGDLGYSLKNRPILGEFTKAAVAVNNNKSTSPQLKK